METAESFTWELRWDGHPPTSAEEILPPRSPGDNGELWAPALKLSKTQPHGRGARFAFHARHAARVHDLDAPQGPGYNSAFLLGLGVWGTKDWVRLDRRQLLHLSTPKDTLDSFDVCWEVKTSADGGRIGRLILQGAHGPAGRAKKPRKGKARAEGAKASRSRP